MIILTFLSNENHNIFLFHDNRHLKIKFPDILEKQTVP